MAISQKIEYESIENLSLDPHNPRLGRSNTSKELSQDKVMDIMKDWSLEELAESFLKSGFWPQEAIMIVRQKLYGEKRLVVVEGNRRLAALKNLKITVEGNPPSKKWKAFLEGQKVPKGLFDKVPYLLADSRDDVTAYIGFRHVTGIKQWKPAEKAEYIAKMIDEGGMSYKEVMSKIGSKTEAVRRNYIAFRILLQMEELEEEISLEKVEDKFSVLFLSLRESNVQDFLGININAEPSNAKKPVPKNKIKDLGYFSAWLFGKDDRAPLFTDSRYVNKFARILGSPQALSYLRSTPDPSFEIASMKAGADEPELEERIRRATDEIEMTLTTIHLYKNSKSIKKAIDRFARGAIALIENFPDKYAELIKGKE